MIQNRFQIDQKSKNIVSKRDFGRRCVRKCETIQKIVKIFENEPPELPKRSVAILTRGIHVPPSEALRARTMRGGPSPQRVEQDS